MPVILRPPSGLYAEGGGEAFRYISRCRTRTWGSHVCHPRFASLYRGLLTVEIVDSHHNRFQDIIGGDVDTATTTTLNSVTYGGSWTASPTQRVIDMMGEGGGSIAGRAYLPADPNAFAYWDVGFQNTESDLARKGYYYDNNGDALRFHAWSDGWTGGSLVHISTPSWPQNVAFGLTWPDPGSGTTHTAYIDGAKFGTLTSNGAFDADSRHEVWLGRGAAVFSYTQWLAIWNRELSASEMALVHADPFGMFRVYQAPVWIPGVTFNESLTEGVGLADVASHTYEHRPSVTEGVGLADTPSSIMEMTDSLAEGIGLADVSSSTMEMSGSLTEGVGLADVVGVSLEISKSLTEGVGLADTASSSKFDPQYARPDEDIGVTVWTTHLGGTTGLYLCIDESTPDDNDYVRSEESPSSSSYECGLSVVQDPDVQGGHQLSYRYRKIGSAQVDLTVKLKAGTTVIKTIQHNDIGTSWTTNEYLLTSAEVTSFRTNGGYADPRLEFIADAP